MDYKIILNPSHGGEDLGINVENTNEKDMTLSIAKYMYKTLTEQGLEVYLLREKDELIRDAERIEKISQIEGDSKNTILITIHYNPDQEDGVEMIYSLKNNADLPRAINDNLISNGFNSKGYYQKRFPVNPTLDYDYISRNTKNLTPIIINYSIASINDRKNSIKSYVDNVTKAILDFLGIKKDTNNYYTTKKGDTLYSIAKQYGISVEYLKDLNNMTNDDLQIGEVLIVPKTTINNQNTYTVKKGDTLWNISKKYNITPSELKEANNLDTNLINIGQELIIPDVRTYQIEKGDSIFNISKKFDIDMNELIDKNDLGDRSLKLGEKIIIPRNNQ